MREKDLDFGIVGGHENFFLAVTVEIGDDRRRETVGFVLDGVVIGEMHPCLSEREITLVLKFQKQSQSETIQFD